MELPSNTSLIYATTCINFGNRHSTTRLSANSKKNRYQIIMRTILLSTLSAIIFLAAFSGCSTTVRTDSGHAVTAGVHTG
jgi:hypothetical protein